ncbi:MAG TPA: carboxyl transferase domain-containing protein, partial [Acidimicrobiales bacterium]|nr:carboxyl transferase domain-containing protein [Acidimicrobiales bacterium]
PIITLVDTPGFLPGKDLEWRGMIRHGAQMAFAYAEATVPRICLLLRKAYGGAYIVMDSRPMGSDLCLAWPSAEVAVMGAKGAVQILHRRVGAEEAAELELEYEVNYLNPWIAAERGLIDDVIDPARTRGALIGALEEIRAKREHVGGRKHANGPL